MKCGQLHLSEWRGETNVKDWQIALIGGAFGLLFAMLFELRDRMVKLQAQIEHLHNVMLAEFGERSRSDSREPRLPSNACDHFRELPPLTSDEVAGWQSGQTMFLVLLEIVSEEIRAAFQVEYVHRELTYLLPGERNAVAYGQARIDSSEPFREVRILFSRPHRTATLRGLSLEGHVKIASDPF